LHSYFSHRSYTPRFAARRLPARKRAGIKKRIKIYKIFILFKFQPESASNRKALSTGKRRIFILLLILPAKNALSAPICFASLANSASIACAV
jgi:hypothetical protein